MALKKVAMALLLHNAAAGVGTALPPYKHRRGFFARGGGFAIGNTGPSEEIEALAGESFSSSRWVSSRIDESVRGIVLCGMPFACACRAASSDSRRCASGTPPPLPYCMLQQAERKVGAQL